MIEKQFFLLKNCYIILATAGLLFSSSSCSTFFLSQRNVEIKEHLTAAEKLLKQGRYDQARKKNELILERYPENPWKDQVLFNLGCLYAFYDYTRKNIDIAKIYFQRLVQEYPQSPFYKETQVWLTMMHELQLKKNELNKIEQEVAQKEKEISGLRQQLNALQKEKTTLLNSMTQEILQKEKKIEELVKKLQIQDKEIANLQAQLKKIRDVDVELEKKKKEVKDQE